MYSTTITQPITIEHKFKVGDIVTPSELIRKGVAEFRIDEVTLGRNDMPVYRMSILTGPMAPRHIGVFRVDHVDGGHELVEPGFGLKFKVGDVLGRKSLAKPYPACEVIGVDRGRYRLRYHLDGSEGTTISAEHIERKYVKLTQTWEVAES